MLISLQVYAPLSRVGVFLDQGSEKYKVKSRHLDTYQGLLELEESLPDYILRPRIQAPKPKSVIKGNDGVLAPLHTLVCYVIYSVGLYIKSCAKRYFLKRERVDRQ